MASRSATVRAWVMVLTGSAAGRDLTSASLRLVFHAGRAAAGVEGVGGEVGAVGPDDGAGVRVDADGGEGGRVVADGGEDGTVEVRAEVDRFVGAVGESEAYHVL